MHGRIILRILALFAAWSCGLAQGTDTAAAAPRIIINLPDNIPPETVWVRYALYGPAGSGGRISRGETLEGQPDFRFQISALFDGAPARYARLVIYTPGCRFVTYDLDLSGGSDISLLFNCQVLMTKTVHGFLNPKEIPSNEFLAEKGLNVAAYLDDQWVCSFFFEPRSAAHDTQGGSCLSSDIPLGSLGAINPSAAGSFDINIPDFTRDPVFDRFRQHLRFGVIELSLKDKLGRTLTTIKAENSSELGLNVQTDYPNPVIFTRVRK